MKKLIKIKKIIKNILEYDAQEIKINKLLMKITNIDNILISQKNEIKLLTEQVTFNKYINILNNYRITIENLKQKHREGKKINVIFFVIFDSVFPCYPIYEKMVKDSFFNPKIVIIPDTSRGDEHMLLTYAQSYKSLLKKYKNVQKGYLETSKKYIDFSKTADIVFYANPYTGMTHPFFEINNFLNKNVLNCYVTYTYFVLKHLSIYLLKLDTYNFFWKIFIESNEFYEEYQKYQTIGGINTIVTGYPKMDKLKDEKIYIRKRKIIIIAPHHTIIKNPLINLSNFYKYANFFLKLPKLYPNIDFIFRPHPLLITTLKKDECWGKKRTETYIKQITNFSNVTYSRGGEYFGLFANSDGIIHDCSSFLVEYLFTEKPMLYLIKNKKQIKNEFMPLAQKSFKYIYKANSKKQIINFIDNIIIKNNDSLKEDRVNFVNKTLKFNYPNVSEKIIDYLKKELS